MKKDKKKVVTQQNLEESRDEILSKGKKFRYPFQYSKHRLVNNAILIAVLAVIAFGFMCWFRLYKAQDTGDVMYRFARTFRMPVAKIDGVNVSYGDYLMLYRSSIKSIEHQQGTLDDSKDSERLKAYYKRQALSDAEDYAYAAAKLAEANNKVTDEEIDEVIHDHKMIDGEERSDAAFQGIIRENFGLSMDEYRDMIRMTLSKKKYAESIDKTAQKMAKEVQAAIDGGEKDFAKIEEAYKENDIFSFESLSEMVDATNLDSGRAAMAMSLKEVGDISPRFVSKNGNGYYFVKLTERDGSKVKYDSIWIRFTELDKALEGLRADNKVEEMIELKDVADDKNEESDQKSEN
ncbi:SurA N-terminal domain-containing protein [Candidatus Saccharibacteria bacterium]|nr:SurA N-terminal domain-containing protein [Candidatus Saccharibacteria bacterium]